MTKLIIGFIPLLDCASLVAASERGFAADEGLDLVLVRETSWANIRDRLIVGHFDAAHMLGPMAVATSLGIGHLKVPLVAPCSLGLARRQRDHRLAEVVGEHAPRGRGAGSPSAHPGHGAEARRGGTRA